MIVTIVLLYLSEVKAVFSHLIEVLFHHDKFPSLYVPRIQKRLAENIATFLLTEWEVNEGMYTYCPP